MGTQLMEHDLNGFLFPLPTTHLDGDEDEDMAVGRRAARRTNTCRSLSAPNQQNSNWRRMPFRPSKKKRWEKRRDAVGAKKNLF